jgi:hypothetical protein
MQFMPCSAATTLRRILAPVARGDVLQRPRLPPKGPVVPSPNDEIEEPRRRIAIWQHLSKNARPTDVANLQDQITDEALVMPVFKLFAESMKEHQVGSIFCAACNPGANYHRECPLGSGIMHHETFTEKSSVSPDYGVVWLDATGVLESVQEPAGVMPNAVSLTVCDKCGAEL